MSKIDTFYKLFIIAPFLAILVDFSFDTPIIDMSRLTHFWNFEHNEKCQSSTQDSMGKGYTLICVNSKPDLTGQSALAQDQIREDDCFIRIGENMIFGVFLMSAY